MNINIAVQANCKSETDYKSWLQLCVTFFISLYVSLISSTVNIIYKVLTVWAISVPSQSQSHHQVDIWEIVPTTNRL